MTNLISFVLVPLFCGVLLYLLPERWLKVLALLIQGSLAVGATLLFRHVHQYGEVIYIIGGWAGPSGITLAADLLSSIMVLLTSGLFFMFMLYNFRRPYVRNMFYTLFFILQSLLLAIFLSTDLFNLYVLIEVSTIIVTLLILFKKEKRSVYDGLIYLMINIVAMSFFLFGLGMIYRLTGVLDFATLKERIPQIEPRQLILPCALMVSAAALKASVFPLFSWLPKAHGTPGAPSIVSAVLSGLYVKAGIYLLIRLQTLFFGVFELGPFFMALGFMTALAGTTLALAQKDIKRILAYSTVSQMGLILVGLGQGTPNAYFGSLYHIINHALFKSTLFLIAGLIIEVYGTRNLHKIHGVFRRMPVAATAACLAILGITGAPLFNGSVSKYLIKADLSGTIFAYGLILINLGTVLYFRRFISMFWGRSKEPPARIPANRSLVLLILASLCLLGGLFGSPVVNWLFPVDLSFSLASYLEKLFLYLATLAGGLVIYQLLSARLARLTRRLVYEPGFNQMCLAIILFFAGHILYLHWLG